MGRGKLSSALRPYCSVQLTIQVKRLLHKKKSGHLVVHVDRDSHIMKCDPEGRWR
jgi:hypothetical protein